MNNYYIRQTDSRHIAYLALLNNHEDEATFGQLV